MTFLLNSKDFVVFLFLDTFRIQSPPCHIQGHSVPPVSNVFAEFKGFCRFPVSRHFPYSRDFVLSPVSKRQNPLSNSKPFRTGDRRVTEYGKCLETEKRQNPLSNSKTNDLFGKFLETGKQQYLLVGPKSLLTGGHRTTF